MCVGFSDYSLQGFVYRSTARGFTRHTDQQLAVLLVIPINSSRFYSSYRSTARGFTRHTDQQLAVLLVFAVSFFLNIGQLP